jgi:hypothetical protein
VLVDRAIDISVSVAVTDVALPESEVDDAEALGEAEASSDGLLVGVGSGTATVGVDGATGVEVVDEPPHAASSVRLVVAANKAAAVRIDARRMFLVMVPPKGWLAYP